MVQCVCLFGAKRWRKACPLVSLLSLAPVRSCVRFRVAPFARVMIVVMYLRIWVRRECTEYATYPLYALGWIPNAVSPFSRLAFSFQLSSAIQGRNVCRRVKERTNRRDGVAFESSSPCPKSDYSICGVEH